MRSNKLLLKYLLVLVTIILLAGCAGIVQKDAAVLKASGVVEIMEVAVSAEIGGRVVEVYVEEGEAVTKEQPLFRLDDEELQIQRQQVTASGEAAVVGAELVLLEAQQALDDLHENWPVQAAQYQVELALAQDGLKDAKYVLSVRQEGNRASSNTLDAAEANLILANEEVDRAQQQFDHASGEAGRALALSNLTAAKQNRDSIQRNLNWYLGSPTEIEQAKLEADVALAEARLAEATQEYEKWKDGPDPDAVALAEANLANAQALLGLARVQAETQLKSIDLRLADAEISAPVGGVILTQSIEVGEVIAPGVAVITLGNVDRMTITVYLGENQYGQVSVGDKATVEVDSFPGESFQAEVTRIADQAEYTPRNVQTEEERQTTVYAVELRLLEGLDQLKPGMPADVIFEIN